MSSSDEYFILDDEHTNPKRLKKERDKARILKKSDWWQQQINKKKCYFCEKDFSPKELTMDHVVPLARGGTSTKGNVVPSCLKCNQEKKLSTPVEELLKKIKI